MTPNYPSLHQSKDNPYRICHELITEPTFIYDKVEFTYNRNFLFQNRNELDIQ